MDDILQKDLQLLLKDLNLLSHAIAAMTDFRDSCTGGAPEEGGPQAPEGRPDGGLPQTSGGGLEGGGPQARGSGPKGEGPPGRP